MKVNIFWFRRDLRLEDNHGLYRALTDKSQLPVIPIFIFDRNILDFLAFKDDARVSFIHQTIVELDQRIKQEGGALRLYYGKAEEVWQQILDSMDVDKVFANNDYEPYAIQRDEKVRNLLKQNGTKFQLYKDHVIFEKTEVVKNDGNPYTVFTPYKRKWIQNLEMDADNLWLSEHLKSYASSEHLNNIGKLENPSTIPALEQMGFQPTDISLPQKVVKQQLIKEYDQKRNFPGIQGTSRLGIHFRFGTISIREKARKASKLNKTFLNELIWRDFYAQILFNFPHVATGPFRDKYARIPWRAAEDEFERWKNGTTGYSLVDAGMRELKTTGFMHNRVRMLTASFLTKHLLIDWRLGEQHFADHLLDFDLASNNGGWQWAAGCGTDAAPYFRIFNPITQQSKFDKNYGYVKQFVPEYGTSKYPDYMIDHKWARQRCLEVYKKALS